MEIIKRKNGKISYREKVYIDGKSITKTFQRKTDAAKWKSRLLIERDRNNSLGIKKLESITVNKYFEIWLEIKRSKSQPRTVDQYISTFKNYIKPVIGEMLIEEVTLRSGHEILNRTLRKVKKTRANYVIRLLKQLFNDAVENDFLMRSVFSKLENVQPDRKDIVFWTKAEVDRFLNLTIGSELYALYLVALNTGMRKAELLGLKWDCIDLNSRIITIKRLRDRYGLKDRTKTNQIRKIGMNDTVFAALKNLRKRCLSLDFVFVLSTGSIIPYQHLSDRYFAQDIKQAGVRKINFKDLRSTYASNYVMNGGSIYDLSKILGHSSVEMTEKKYADLSIEHIKEKSNVVNFCSSPFLAHNNSVS
ncbi:site-specific integrase [Bacteriovoracaceae bacterium]|nr:site-specific integrase [Bacteriovoracaceae bacterium]